VLDECNKNIGNHQSSCIMISKKSQHIKKYIVPMISYTANSPSGIGKKISPIPSVDYVHSRMEIERKSEVIHENNSQMSPDFLCDYVAHEDRNKRCDTHENTPPKKRLRVSSHDGADLLADAVELPLPLSGNDYRRQEAANILSTSKWGTRQITSVMNKMIQLKYVPSASMHFVA
jgi:hypothetical protein